MNTLCITVEIQLKFHERKFDLLTARGIVPCHNAGDRRVAASPALYIVLMAPSDHPKSPIILLSSRFTFSSLEATKLTATYISDAFSDADSDSS